jgi:hypothetical protein
VVVVSYRLTVLGLCTACASHFLGLLSTLTGSKILGKWKLFMTTLSTPLELLVTMVYWSIKSYDPMLLVNPAIQKRLPLFLDVSLHMLPAVFGLFDVLLFNPVWTVTISSVLKGYTMFAVGYWIWVHHTFSQNGYFPYPVST